MEKHSLIGGKVHIYKRPNSRHWQCSTYLDGKNWRVSTKEDSLSRAKDFAEDWYFELRGKSRVGELKSGKTFTAAAELFIREFKAITAGQRSPKYVENQALRVRVHLIPFFESLTVGEITASKVQDYRVHRAIDPKTGKPLAWSTLHQEIVALRQVLKTALRHGWIDHLPDMSAPYRSSGKVGHRAWFSPKEYRQLYQATRRRAKEPLNERWRWESEQFHDYVLFMANTGLRPDEAARLEYRDVTIVKDEATGQVILEIEVRGKRGVGFCKSTSGAVVPFRRLRARNKPQLTDRLFPHNQRELLNAVLEEEGLKFDRDGNRRTAYSLRHTYICLRLMEGADIYQIAKNCRTSVEMIEKYYATHIKTTLDAAAINVRRQRPERPGRKTDEKHRPAARKPLDKR